MNLTEYVGGLCSKGTMVCSMYSYLVVDVGVDLPPREVVPDEFIAGVQDGPGIEHGGAA